MCPQYLTWTSVYDKAVHATWVPCLLILDQIHCQQDVSSDLLALYMHNPTEFLYWFITFDEVCVQHKTLDTKQQSTQWTTKYGLIPKKAKTIPSAGKVMLTVFLGWSWNNLHWLFYKGKTVNSEHYSNLLHLLNDEVNKNRSHLVKKKVMEIKELMQWLTSKN